MPDSIVHSITTTSTHFILRICVPPPDDNNFQPHIEEIAQICAQNEIFLRGPVTTNLNPPYITLNLVSEPSDERLVAIRTLFTTHTLFYNRIPHGLPLFNTATYLANRDFTNILLATHLAPGVLSDLQKTHQEHTAALEAVRRNVAHHSDSISAISTRLTMLERCEDTITNAIQTQIENAVAEIHACLCNDMSAVIAPFAQQSVDFFLQQRSFNPPPPSVPPLNATPTHASTHDVTMRTSPTYSDKARTSPVARTTAPAAPHSQGGPRR